jgi:hypothetical protein
MSITSAKSLTMERDAEENGNSALGCRFREWQELAHLPVRLRPPSRRFGPFIEPISDACFGRGRSTITQTGDVRFSLLAPSRRHPTSPSTCMMTWAIHPETLRKSSFANYVRISMFYVRLAFALCNAFSWSGVGASYVTPLGFRFADHAFRSSFTNKSSIFRRCPDLDSGTGEAEAEMVSDARSVPADPFPNVNQPSRFGRPALVERVDSNNKRT